MSQRNPEDSIQKEEYCYRHLYETPGDMKIVIAKTGEEISAHKMVLIRASPTFEQYFRSRPDTDKLVLQQIDPEPVRQMLSYIYRGHCYILPIYVVQLYNLGCCYSLHSLLQKCGQWLMEEAELALVLNLYAAKLRVELPGLAEHCARVIRSKIMAAFGYAKFYHLQVHQMSQLLSKIEELPCNLEHLLPRLDRWRKSHPTDMLNQCNGVLHFVYLGFKGGRRFGEKHGLGSVALSATRSSKQPYYEGMLKAAIRCRVFGVGLYLGPASAFPTSPSGNAPEVRVRVTDAVDKGMKIPQQAGVYDLLFSAFQLGPGEGLKLSVTIAQDWPPHPAGGWYEGEQRFARNNVGEHLRLCSVDWNFLPVAYVLYELVDDSSNDEYSDGVFQEMSRSRVE